MPLTLDEITNAALSLPPDSKILLAEKIVERLASDEPEIERLWSAEAVRRRDEIRSGRTKPIPGTEVIEEVRRLVGR